MKYNLSLSLDRQKADARYESLKARGAFIEIVDKSSRTKAQNSYEHLLMGIVAMDIGISLEECKEYYFKRLVNPDIFVVRKTMPFIGEVCDTLSTSDITQEQTSVAIDRFKRWMYENGYFVPSPTDDAVLRDIEIEMGRMEQYLGR